MTIILQDKQHEDTLVRTVDRSGSVVTVVNTVAEITVYSYLIPAGQLKLDRTLKVCLYSDFLNNAGGNQNFTLRAKIGAVTVFGDNTGNISAGAIRRPAYWEFSFGNLGAANSNAFQGWSIIGASLAGSVAGIGDLAAAGLRESVFAANNSTTTIDTTVDQLFAVTIQLGAANAQLDFRRVKAIAVLT
jgi:hypothetical protein